MKPVVVPVTEASMAVPFSTMLSPVSLKETWDIGYVGLSIVNLSM